MREFKFWVCVRLEVYVNKDVIEVSCIRRVWNKEYKIKLGIIRLRRKNVIEL